jgi:hypothetical protein
MSSKFSILGNNINQGRGTIRKTINVVINGINEVIT